GIPPGEVVSSPSHILPKRAGWLILCYLDHPFLHMIPDTTDLRLENLIDDAFEELGDASVSLKEPFQNRVVYGNLVLSHWGTLLEMCDFCPTHILPKRAPMALYVFGRNSFYT
ncbi:hypothetical protein, partial [Hydrogenibacillus schlegelii]